MRVMEEWIFRQNTSFITVVESEHSEAARVDRGTADSAGRRHVEQADAPA